MGHTYMYTHTLRKFNFFGGVSKFGFSTEGRKRNRKEEGGEEVVMGEVGEKRFFLVVTTLLWFIAISLCVRRPQGQVIPEELHNERRVFV